MGGLADKTVVHDDIGHQEQQIHGRPGETGNHSGDRLTNPVHEAFDVQFGRQRKQGAEPNKRGRSVAAGGVPYAQHAGDQQHKEAGHGHRSGVERPLIGQRP